MPIVHVTRRRGTPSERFWRHVDRDGPTPEHRPDLGPCWLWTGALRNNGYGAFGIGVGRLENRVVDAHRAAWELFRGAIPDGLLILHHCDRKPCVNYERHLFPGTYADNVRDMMDKGRGRWPGVPGQKNGNAILTDEQVRAILAEPSAYGYRNRLAVQYGVSQSLISSVRQARAWKHLKV